MKELNFVKAQGIGNDFVIVNCLSGILDEDSLPGLGVRICDRHFGIGGDGLILVLPSAVADYRMRVINSDGSEAEMCGNGVRCFARYLLNRGLVGRSLSVETLAGIKHIDVVDVNGDVWFSVNMGTPALDAAQIPIAGYEGRVISQPLDVEGTRFDITCVSMGNPHCVIFVPSVAEIPLEQLGPKIETHPAFPRKTNVEFAEVLSPSEVRMRVWERGAGVTLACGTGAASTVVAGVLNGKLNRKATVHLPGGDLQIDWRDNDEIFMTGPAEEVFSGTIKI